MVVGVFSSHFLWRQSPWSRGDVYYTLRCISEYYTLQCALCTTKKEPTRVTQEGVNTGAFLFLLVFFFCPTVLLRCLV